ncbi:Peptidase family M50 [compost metagenome]
MDLVEIGAKVGIYFIPFLFALCFHEFAHGFVAKMRGDNTAQQMGRLTLNPVAHMDMLGTLILPIMAIVLASPIFFGWAKPVPVNSRNLKNPRVDMFWIALAGPLSNVFLAVVGALAMGGLVRYGMGLSYTKALLNILDVFIVTNLFLAIFNLIPLNPLDGGKVLARFLPASLNHKLEQYEHLTSMVLMVLVLTGMLRILAIPVFWGHDLLVRTVMGGYL